VSAPSAAAVSPPPPQALKAVVKASSVHKARVRFERLGVVMGREDEG
jgi:hypothetical protein